MTISNQAQTLTTPSLKRRLASIVYESMLLFGLIFFSDFVFDVATQSRHALSNRFERSLMLFIVIGCYFIYFWRHGGQTLAMKTWKIKLVDLNNHRISFTQAILRYCLIWMWFIPALTITAIFDLKQWEMIAALTIGLIAWTMTIYTNKDQQFLHDVISKTRMIDESSLPPIKK